MQKLIEAWLDAKMDETLAKERRVETERQLLDAIIDDGVELKEEGSKTVPHGGHKIVVTSKVYRKADFELLDAVLSDVPVNLHPIKTERKIDDKGIRWLRDNDPELYRKISKCITATPGKPGIAIKKG